MATRMKLRRGLPTVARARPAAGAAETVTYWTLLAGIYLLQGSVWFFAFKPKLLETVPPAVQRQFAGTIVDRAIGVDAAWVVLGVAELLVFAALAVSVATGELLPARRKPFLLGALSGGMMTLGILIFGSALTSDGDLSAQLYAYFAGTAVVLMLVLQLPPYRARWLRPAHADDGER